MTDNDDDDVIDSPKLEKKKQKQTKINLWGSNLTA